MRTLLAWLFVIVAWFFGQKSLGIVIGAIWLLAEGFHWVLTPSQKRLEQEKREKFLKELPESFERRRTEVTASTNVEDELLRYLKARLESSPFSSCTPKDTESLGTWMNRPDLPESLKQITATALQGHLERFAQLRAEKSEEHLRSLRLRAEREKRGEEVFRRLKNTYSEKIDRFVEIAYREVAKRDEYGDENVNAFNTEAHRFFEKLSNLEPDIQREFSALNLDEDRSLQHNSLPNQFTPILSSLYSEMKKRFEEYYKAQKARPKLFSQDSVRQLVSGVDFEVFMIDLLTKLGATGVSGTPKTGDQGGDVLFQYAGIRVVVQAKFYSGTVGNQAVQEVVAARGYYSTNEAWVVTNSSFTNSARELAQKNGVVLIDGALLEQFEDFFAKHFSIPEEPLLKAAI